MHLERILYMVVFLGSVVYFLLYGLVMKKLPIIMISYDQGSSNTQEIVTALKRRHSIASTKKVSHEISVLKEVRGNISRTRGTQLPKSTRKTKTLTDEFNLEEELPTTENLKLEINSFLFYFRNDKKLSNTVKPQTSPPLTTTAKTISKPKNYVFSKLMKVVDRLDTKLTSNPSQECIKPKRVGPIDLGSWKMYIPLKQLENELSFVRIGGSWKPTNCQATKVAIVVPFRDRQSHLTIFLKRIHQFMRWQLLDYKIYVVEQNSEHAFNRGILMNIGFEEAMKHQKYDCIIFHDVDLLPEDDRNDYSCPSSPRHMSTAVDTLDYKLGYKKIFGGVEAFWPEHFRYINGFPNRYWGWGGEDDDLYIRIIKNSLGLTRPAQQIGRYTMIKHEKSKKNKQRFAMLKESDTHLKKDGLNSLKYKIVKQMEYHLYTMISVDISPDSEEQQSRWSGWY